MIQRFPRKREQLVLEQGLCPVAMTFTLALRHFPIFLPPDYLLPQQYDTESVTVYQLKREIFLLLF